MGKHIKTKFKSRAQKRKYYQKLVRVNGSSSVDEVSKRLLNLTRFSGNRRIRRIQRLIRVKPRNRHNIIGWEPGKSFDQIWSEYEKKCHKWALDTVAVIKSILDSPAEIASVVDGGSISDTGNLANSIGILKEEYDKASGKIHIRIGVHSGSGPDGIKAPPDWLHSPRYGHKRNFHAGEREMPYEDYSPYVIGKTSRSRKFGGYPVMQKAVQKVGEAGDSFTFKGGFGSPRIQRLLTDIARENAKKIILGK